MLVVRVVVLDVVEPDQVFKVHLIDGVLVLRGLHLQDQLELVLYVDVAAVEVAVKLEAVRKVVVSLVIGLVPAKSSLLGADYRLQKEIIGRLALK